MYLLTNFIAGLFALDMYIIEFLFSAIFIILSVFRTSYSFKDYNVLGLTALRLEGCIIRYFEDNG